MRKTLDQLRQEKYSPLNLIRVNPDIIKSVLVMTFVSRRDSRLISAMCVPGQIGIGRSDWGPIFVWYTGTQFNAMVERVKAAGLRPRWETRIYRNYPHSWDNRFKWNASRTESTVVKDA